MPTPQIESWEKEFAKFWGNLGDKGYSFLKLGHPVNNKTPEHPKTLFKSFIKSLLSSQRSEIVEMVEGTKKLWEMDMLMFENYVHSGEHKDFIDYREGGIKALTDLLTKIKK